MLRNYYASRLYSALKADNVKKIESFSAQLKNQKINLEKRFADGQTLLMLAAEKGYESCVQALIEAKAAVQAAENDGGTALMSACMMPWDKRSRENIVRMLLTAKAAVNVTDTHNMTALNYACQWSSREIVKHLLMANASIHTGDHEGEPLIFTAAGRFNCVGVKHSPVLQAEIAAMISDLIEAKASVNERWNNWTLFDVIMSCDRPHLATVKLLLNHRADIHVNTMGLYEFFINSKTDDDKFLAGMFMLYEKEKLNREKGLGKLYIWNSFKVLEELYHLHQANTFQYIDKALANVMPKDLTKLIHHYNDSKENATPGLINSASFFKGDDLVHRALIIENRIKDGFLGVNDVSTKRR